MELDLVVTKCWILTTPTLTPSYLLRRSRPGAAKEETPKSKEQAQEGTEKHDKTFSYSADPHVYIFTIPISPSLSPSDNGVYIYIL